MTKQLHKLTPWLVAAICSLAGAAGAQVRPEAEQLFRDGKELIKQGKLAEACAAFEASERAEHSLATVMSLADCREKNRQYASAWALFLRADSATRMDPARAGLNATARSRAAALEPRLSYLTISVPDESRVEGLIVLRDNLPIDPAEWNRAIPLDGGPHEVSGKAPGHESWSTRLTLAPERDKQSVEVPKFKELPKLVAPQPPLAPLGTATPPAAPAAAPKAPGRWTPGRKLALGLAAGSVVLAGAGVGFALDARSLDNESLARCPPPACSAEDAAAATALNDRAQRRALIANIGLVSGGVAFVAGAVLWYVSGPTGPEAAIPGYDNRDGYAVARRAQPHRTLTITPQLGEAPGLVLWGRF